MDLTSTLRGALGGRSAFVTGHTGFKGSWLALWLSELGARVTGYALCPEAGPSNFAASRVRNALCAHHEADIRDRPALRRALEAADADVIYHLAARSLVLDGYQDPHETFDVNVMGTSCLLDCIREIGRPCVVLVVTSDKCYENREQVWGWRECDPLGGDDPYSASKGAAEIITAAYRRSFFSTARAGAPRARVASARAGNCIGGGDWARHRIVPDIVRALAEGRPVQLRNPRSIRPWQHVLESLSGYLLLTARMLTCEDRLIESSWNFGPMPGDELTVAELVREFLRTWGAGSWEDAGGADGPGEAAAIRLSVDKAVLRLGWRPRWDVREAIRRTAAWYARHARDPSADMSVACREDIAAYAGASPVAGV